MRSVCSRSAFFSMNFSAAYVTCFHIQTIKHTRYKVTVVMNNSLVVYSSCSLQITIKTNLLPELKHQAPN